MEKKVAEPDSNIQDHIVETNGKLFFSITLQARLVDHPELTKLPFKRDSGDIIILEITDEDRERFRQNLEEDLNIRPGDITIYPMHKPEIPTDSAKPDEEPKGHEGPAIYHVKEHTRLRKE